MEKKDYPTTEEEDDYRAFIAAEPAGAYAYSEDLHTVCNYDKIEDVGPLSLDELMSDLRQAEREVNNPNQWDTLDHFLTSFKNSHAAWFK